MISDPPPGQSLKPGSKLDRYELLCPVAQGGMASVWLARLSGAHGFEKLVAVKTILPQYARDEHFRSMFLDEARIAARVEHVNVAQILELGEQDGILFLAMEWVDGDPLSTLHREVRDNGATFPVAVAVRILADVCAGLHAAHELRDRNGALLNVVHRDVSPQNVLVAHGVAKLIDFGVAKARDRLAGETSTGELKGKVSYMAPEQALGFPIDRRVDVFAAGAILYQLLAGRAPFEASTQIASLHRVAGAEPAPPLPADVPAPIAAVIARALEKDVDKRYPTALSLQQDLEAALAKVGLSATPAHVAEFVHEHLADRARKRKRLIEEALAHVNEKRDAQPPRLAESTVFGATPSGNGLPLSTADVPTLVDVAQLPNARAAKRSSKRGRVFVVVGIAIVACGVALLVSRAREDGAHGDAPVAASSGAATTPSASVAAMPSPSSIASPSTTTASSEVTTTTPSIDPLPTVDGKPSVAPAKTQNKLAAPSASAKPKKKVYFDDGF